MKVVPPTVTRHLADAIGQLHMYDVKYNLATMRKVPLYRGPVSKRYMLACAYC